MYHHDSSDMCSHPLAHLIYLSYQYLVLQFLIRRFLTSKGSLQPIRMVTTYQDGVFIQHGSAAVADSTRGRRCVSRYVLFFRLLWIDHLSKRKTSWTSWRKELPAIIYRHALMYLLPIGRFFFFFWHTCSFQPCQCLPTFEFDVAI